MSSNPVKHSRDPVAELLCESVALEIGSLEPEPILLSDKSVAAWIEATHPRIVESSIECYVGGTEVRCNGCLATAHPGALPTLIHTLLVRAHGETPSSDIVLVKASQKCKGVASNCC
jgi:hypothetical protein